MEKFLENVVQYHFLHTNNYHGYHARDGRSIDNGISVPCKGHFIDYIKFGLWKGYSNSLYGIKYYCCHYINDKEIGCEVFHNLQYYFKTPGKRFGEQIKWKMEWKQE